MTESTLEIDETDKILDEIEQEILQAIDLEIAEYGALEITKNYWRGAQETIRHVKLRLKHR